MKRKNAICPTGLLLVPLMPAAISRSPGVRSWVPSKPVLGTSRSSFGAKPPIARVHTHTVPIVRWQAEGWNKKLFLDVGD